MSRARALAAALVLVSACAKQPPALPSPLDIEELAIPWANAFPSDVVVDGRGRVWFTDRMTHAVGRYDPETGAFERFPTPTPKSAPYGLIASPDGSTLWFGESTAGRLGRVDVATAGITEVQLPELAGGGPHLLAWSTGRVWFTAREAFRWGWYEPATGRAATHPFSSAPPDTGRIIGRRPKPYSIAPARGGGVWIGTYDGPLLMRARPGVDTLEPHALRRPQGQPISTVPDSILARFPGLAASQHWDNVGARRSAVDADGNLWVADFIRGRVVRWQERSDTFDAFASLARNAGPYGIGVDPWGRVWFHEILAQNLVVLDPRTGDRAAFPLRRPNTPAIRHIAFDARRRWVWLPISDAGVLARVRLP